MAQSKNAGNAPDWHRDENGNCPCGMCGQWVKPFRLVDVRQHLITSLRAAQFLCDGCLRRLMNPGRHDPHRPIKKSAFVRGLPGSEATARAHGIRQAARDNPKRDTQL
jgi:hypothetical protein